MKAARIVLTTFGSYGDAFPFIGLAKALKDRGHHPVLATSAFYREMVEREGIEFWPVRPDVDYRDRERVERVMDPRHGPTAIIRDWLMESLRASHADLDAAAAGADAIVTHPVTFAGPIVAQRRGLRWASAVLAPLSFFSSYDLPLASPAGWLRNVARIPGAAAGAVRLAKLLARGWSRPAYDLRRELGMERGKDPVFDGQHSPRLVLGLFSRVLGPPRPDWPRHVVVTGAVWYNGPDADRPLSPGLQEFLDGGPPPIVFTLGSSAVGVAGDFFEESVAAVEALGERAVLLVGPQVENRPARLTENVHLEPFAPHSALFPRASAIVHQGGAGTLHQALRAGSPTLIVPFAHDQPDNAYRVEQLGVSRTLGPGVYRRARVARELRALLGDPTYRSRAETVAATVRGERGAAAAADAVEGLLA